MADLSTSYLGLSLKNPIVAASSGISKDIEGVKKLADSGVGAIVLKSLFEEQINFEIHKSLDKNTVDYTETYDYIGNFIKDKTLDEYLTLIEEAKKQTDIPIIASINCVSPDHWVSFAEKIETAGADAIELNVSILPFDENLSCEVNEKNYFSILKNVRKHTKLPIALKMSYYSSGLAKLIKRLSWTHDVDGFVLFNRYYCPDINIDDMSLTTTNIFSNSKEIGTSLRWIALMYGKIETDLIASTGNHTGEDVVKQILTGAAAVQVASVLYKKGPEEVKNILATLESWMDKNGFKTLDDFRGKMSSKTSGHKAFERVQFMKYYGGME